MADPLTPGLHVVATPIGNLGDLSPRAAETLRRADRILAEDTRVTGKLLAHVGAKAPMSRYDDHSSDRERDAIVARLGDQAIALVSDAGTPLISDPGYKLVRAARAAGYAVHTVPGPCAAGAAPKGEIVIVVGPPAKSEEVSDAELDAMLDDALTRLSPSRAAGEVAERLKVPRKRAYARALERAR